MNPKDPDLPIITPELAEIIKQQTTADTPEKQAAADARFAAAQKERKNTPKTPRLDDPEKLAQIAIAGKDGAKKDGKIVAEFRGTLKRNKQSQDPAVQELLIGGFVNTIKAFDVANNLPPEQRGNAQKISDQAILDLVESLKKLPGDHAPQGLAQIVIAPSIKAAGRLGIGGGHISRTLFMGSTSKGSTQSR